MLEKTAVVEPRVRWTKEKCLLVTVHLLSSMRAGLIILLMIALSAVAGTVFTGIYTSWFFRMLESVLCLNIALCSMRRFLRLWEETFLRVTDFSLDIQKLPASFSATVPLGCRINIEQVLTSMGYKTSRHSKDNGFCIYGVRGRFVPWGSFLVHISILLIILGGLIGSVYGSDSEVMLPVGGVYTVKDTQSESFDIRLDGFKTEHYQDGTVSDWISDITVVNNGQHILSSEVKVNHPLSYNGIKIYQKSYGTVLKAQVLDESGGILTEKLLAEKEKLKLGEDSDTVIQPVRYIPDFDAVRPMISRSPAPNNPYVLYIVNSGGRESWGAAPVGAPLKFDRLGIVKFIEAVPASGLELKYDPGLMLVLLGFLLMTFGFFTSLYGRHSKLWAVITDDCEQYNIDLYMVKTAKGEKTKVTTQFMNVLRIGAKNI